MLLLALVPFGAITLNYLGKARDVVSQMLHLAAMRRANKHGPSAAPLRTPSMPGGGDLGAADLFGERRG